MLNAFKKISELVQDRLWVAGAYRRVFETEDGKAVLHHLIRNNYVRKPTFVNGNPELGLIHEGQRRLVLSIINILDMDDEQLRTILRDNHE